MNFFTLPVLLCGLLAGQSATGSNLDFSARTLAAWEGEGFTLHIASGEDPKNAYSVSSKDPGTKGTKAFLHQAFIVPAGTGVIRFKACAIRAKDCPADANLDVLLMAAGKRILPKRVRTDDGWKNSDLLPPRGGQERDYIWPVADHVGNWLRIVLLDEDERPGCYVKCGGFHIQTQEEFEAAEFGKDPASLAGGDKLPPMVRYSSQHFTAMSNADDTFTESRLKLCEMMYSLFYDHFRQKGFTLFSPASKLLVSMFDSQASFEACLGRKMPADVTGLYQLRSNRLLMYDYGKNESFVAKKQQALQKGQRISLQMDRLRYLDGVERAAKESRADTNTATILHEVAHQLSFNCGMLNREGDLPLWLAEGLACYCEATADGVWQGIGEANPARLATLADAFQAKQPLFTLREMLESDRLLQGSDIKTIFLAYAQSWALFRLLAEEEPDRLRSYLKLTYSERVQERRVANFQQAFGNDWPGHERRHAAYIKNLIQLYMPAKKPDSPSPRRLQSGNR